MLKTDALLVARECNVSLYLGQIDDGKVYVIKHKNEIPCVGVRFWKEEYNEVYNLPPPLSHVMRERRKIPEVSAGG